MSFSSSRNSDLLLRYSSSASFSPSIRSHHLRRADHSGISFDYGGRNDGLIDYTFVSDPKKLDVGRSNRDRKSVNGGKKSVDVVWKAIVSGEKRTIMKEKAQEEEDLMTLEEFLAKAAAAATENGDSDEIDVKIPPERFNDGGYIFDYPMIEGSIGGGKRGRVMMEIMGKAAAKRQKRMIKNRECAARSRERKQAYQVELETLAAKLEEENEQLLKEIEEKTRKRYKKLIEPLIPVVEKRKPSSSSAIPWNGKRV